MAKNSQSSKNQQKKKQENRVCEKIFRAVTSPLRTVRRMSTKPSSNQPAEAVHVKFTETSTQGGKPITKIEPKKTVITRVETTIKTDERFADYIKRAKLKIRAMSNLSDMTSETSETESRDHHHHHHHHHQHHTPNFHVISSSERSSDQFAEYIKKAKMKLSSSSTITRDNQTYDSFRD